MIRYLLLHTEPPTRAVLARLRPGRLVFASDEVTPADRAAWDECIELPPADDVAGTLAALSGVAFDALVIQTEYGLLPGALLAARRGLPGPSPAAAHLAVNKWLQRRALAAAGLEVPRFALCRDAAGVRRFAASFPLALKPVASTLARGVRKVDRPEQIEVAVAGLARDLACLPDPRRLRAFAAVAGLDPQCDPRRDFLVEEWIEGPVREVDGLVFGRQAIDFGVLEQEPCPPPSLAIAGYRLPVQAPALAARARAAVAALGLTDCGFAVEFRGERIIEVNGRLGEDDGFPDLFHAAAGVWPIEKWLRRDARPVALQRAAAVAYLCHSSGGRVVKAGAPPGVHLLVGPDDRLAGAGQPGHAPHLAWALATDARSAERAAGRAREALQEARVELLPA